MARDPGRSYTSYTAWATVISDDNRVKTVA
jgi:hypothetical protein